MAALASAGPSFAPSCANDSDPYASKIGGVGAWFPTTKPQPSIPACSICACKRYLFIQVFAPDPSPRSLLLYGCPRPACVLKSSSWKCYRSQLARVVHVVAPAPAPAPTIGWDDTTTLAADDDWGAAGDWGAPAVAESIPSSAAASSSSSKTWASVVSASIPVAPPAAETAESLAAALSGLSFAAGSSSIVGAFAPLELQWFDEPIPQASGKLDALTSRALRMLEKYREEEGAEDFDDGTAASGGGGGGGESYERLPAAQKCLLKFQETIALAPDQLVRYEFGGTPLWQTPAPTAAALEKAVPRCACGQKRVFEFQVLPTLINYLEVSEDPAVTAAIAETLDWDSVLVYSCPDSCEASVEEAVFAR